MTNPTPPEPSPGQNRWNHLLSFVRRPSTLITGSILIAVGVAGYTGVRFFVYEKLPPLLSTELSKFLKRKVTVGEVESFSFNHIRVGASSVPANFKDPDNLSIKAIEVGVNPLPLLIGQPLSLEVTLVAPNIYIEQDKNGKWIDFELPKGKEEKLPIDINAKIHLEDGDIALLPQKINKPLNIKLKGNGDYQYRRKGNQQVGYDIDVNLLNSEVMLKGNTVIETGKSQVELAVKKLALAELVALIPNSPIKLNSGQFQANFNLNLPSWEKIRGTQGLGKINLTEFNAKITPLKAPLKATLKIGLQGQDILVEEATINLGKLKTQIQGTANWDKGYNLNIDVQPVLISSLLKTLAIALPVKVDGEIQGKLKLNGLINQPNLTGVINNTKPLQVEKTQIKEIKTQFQANLNQVTLQTFQIKPTVGGQITGKGTIKTDILKAMTAKKPIDWQKIPLDFSFQSQLPTEKLISPYYNSPQKINIGILTAQGQVKGTLGKPIGLIKWQTPNASTVSGIDVSGTGELTLTGDNFRFTNTNLQTKSGKIVLNGNGSFKSKQWQTYITANSFALTPFLPLICQQISCPNLTAFQPLNLANANIRLTGRLDNFSVSTLNGNGNLLLTTKTGTVAVTSQVSKGILTASAVASQIPLNSLQNYLSLPANFKLTKPLILETANIRFVSQLENFSLNKVNGIANLVLNYQGGKARVNSQLSQGNIQASVFASQISVNSFVSNLSTPVNIAQTRVNFSGSLAQLFPNSILNINSLKATGDVQLFIENNQVKATGILNNGILNAVANTGQISLNKFIPQLPVATKLISSNIQVSGNLQTILASWEKNPDFSTLKATANLNLIVAKGSVKAVTQLNNNQWQTNLIATQINPNFIPALKSLSPVNATLNLSGNLNSLFQPDKLFLITANKITAKTKDQNLTAKGTILISSLLKSPDIANVNLDIQAKSKLDNLPLNEILSLIPAQRNLLPQELKLTGIGEFKGNLTGKNLLTAFTTAGNLKLNGNLKLTAKTKDQNLTAKGTILISSLLKSPDIANVNLDIQAKSKLDNLPLNEILSLIPAQRNLLPQELKLTGIGEFKGNLTGKNLLTAFATAGNLKLNGNLKLLNFAFNNRAFDPVLTGTIKASLGENIALDLRGKNDVIAANLEPCKLSQCRFAYLPTSFEIRQATDSQFPIIAEGKRQGDRLLAKLQNFPLELLKIVPGVDYGFPGTLTGIVNGNLDLNLINLTGNANLQIKEPTLGLIKFQEFTANIDYQGTIAKVNAATLVVGNSRYNLQGQLNLKSGELQGNLNINKGKVQEILTALQISDINSLVDFIQFKKPDYGKANQVQPETLGDSDAALREQVNLLAVIDQKIRDFARKQQSGSVPTELDIRGLVNANVTLGGTLKHPQVDFQLQGNNWSWYPQSPVANIINPLGLVKQSTQVIPINEVQLQGSLNKGFIQIQTAQIKIQDAVISLTGKFFPKRLDANFAVNNLSLDTLNNFVPLPADISGIINLKGAITGSLAKPQIVGQISLADAALNARLIDRMIVGNFNYANNRFQLRTIDSSTLQAYISIPYPTESTKNDLVEVDVRIGTEEMPLLSVLTQDQLTWLGGEGEIDFKGSGRLDLRKQFRLYDLSAKGKVILKDAIIKSAAFPEPLTVNGEATINNDLLTVQQLQGSFAETQLAISGNLPLFTPLPANSSQAANPLTVVINKGKLNLQGLYTGGIDAQVMVTGAALSPIIGGTVRLNQGLVFIPEAQPNTIQASSGFSRWLKVRQRQAAIVPKLANFRVILEGLAIEQLPLYRFEFGGDLVLNGSLDNLNNVQPKGSIRLDRGIFNFLDTRFLVNRRRNNVISFQPAQGLLNPDLDLQVRAIVSELPQAARQRDEESNEIPDNSLNRLQRIDITLSMKGQLSQLLPNFGKDEALACRLPRDTFQPIPQETGFTPEELQKLSTCLQVLAAKGSSADQQLLSNPVIKLTSSPPRSQGQIVRLLGEQLFVLADSLQGKNGDQLLQTGIVQLAVPLLLQGVLYDVESAIGNSIGTADFRLFPFAETVYRVDKEGFVRLSYDYNFNEFRVQYETRF